MKRSVKVAFCGIVTAIAGVIMTASFIPNITFAVPAIAGVLLAVVFAQVGFTSAVLSFIASAFISFFISDKTSWILFVVFFGYYPIVKPLIEKIKKPVLVWLLKFLVFNISAICCYFIEILFFDFEISIILLAAVFAVGNAVFAIYDIAVSRIASLYYLRFHNRISKTLRK